MAGQTGPTIQSWGSTGWQQDPTTKAWKQVNTPSSYGAGLGAPYSAGTGGQVMTDDDRAWYTAQTGMNSPQAVWGLGITDPTKNPLSAGPSGMNRYDLYNQQQAALRGGVGASVGGIGAGSGASISGRVYGSPGVGAAPAWGNKFLEDQLARIRRNSDRDIDVSIDALENAGLGTVGGAHSSTKGELVNQREQAERGAAADNERLAQEYALRWEEAQQRAADRQLAMNAAQWSSISDAAGRLGSGANAGYAGGAGGSGAGDSPLTGSVFGVNFGTPGSPTKADYPSQQRPNIYDPNSVSDEELYALLTDWNKRQKYGFTLKEIQDAINSNQRVGA